jgi:hypothetical protein
MGEVINFREHISPEEAQNIRMRKYARHRRRCHYLWLEEKKKAESRKQSDRHDAK